jgi:hypothetical protein
MDFITATPVVAPTNTRNTAASSNKLLHLVLERQDMYSCWTRSLAWYQAATGNEHQLLQKHPPKKQAVFTPIEVETQQFVLSYIGR